MPWVENFIRSILGRSVAVRLTNPLKCESNYFELINKYRNNISEWEVWDENKKEIFIFCINSYYVF